MESDPDILLVARAMFGLYADRTLSVMERRIASFSADRNSEMAGFWWHVVEAVREMQAGHRPA